MTVDAPAEAPPRRWFRFRLRTLLIVAPLLTIAAAYGAHSWYLSYLHRWAIEQVEQAGGLVVLDETGAAVKVELPGKTVDDAKLARLIPALASLPELKTLVLASNEVTDTGIGRLVELRRLRIVYLADTKVTKQGIAKLQEQHPELKVDLTPPHARAMRLAMRPIYQHAIISLAMLDDQTLLGGNGLGSVLSWDVKSAQLASHREAHDDWTFAVVKHPHQPWIATGGGDGLIKLWDAASGREIGRFAGHDDDVHGLAFTPDGRTLVSTGDDMSVRVWDVATRKEKHTLYGHEETIPAVAVSPDGTIAASASRDGTIRLWNIASGEHQATLTGHADDVLSVAFHPDGNELASASYDGTVKLWNVAERRATHSFSGHRGWAFAVRYSPHGEQLVSTSGDGVRLWDRATRSLLWHDTSQANVSAALWLDEMRFATAAADGSVMIWHARGAALATLWTTFGEPAADDGRIRVAGATK